MANKVPKIAAIAPWYGSNRSLAHKVGDLLAGCKHVTVPFAGGMCELPYITANIVVVSDLHRHVINLARVIQQHREKLQQTIEDTAFHPNQLVLSQNNCRRIESSKNPPDDESACFWWAFDYFCCVWMSRSATAGTDSEFNGAISTRWIASGGDSVVRFRNAGESLTAWQEVMRRCSFVCMDFFDLIEKVADLPENGLYNDSPFPGPGDNYKHKFGEPELRRMAARLAKFEKLRIVTRYYDHPLIRELYPEDRWTWHRLDGGKTQKNKEAPEVLLVNRTGN